MEHTKRGRRPILRITAEFFVIVAGVLVALAVDGWADARTERELELMYMGRLRNELAQTQESLLADYYGGVEAHARAALPNVARERPVTDTAGLVVAAYHAHRMLAPGVRDGTYRELLSTGNLQVLRDLELRTLLANFYNEAEFWSHTFGSDWQDTEFNKFVRGKIPPEVQFAIADQCPMEETHPFQCVADLGGWDPMPFVNALRANPAVGEALTRRIRDVMRVKGQLDDLVTQLDTLMTHLN